MIETDEAIALKNERTTGEVYAFDLERDRTQVETLVNGISVFRLIL
ncbi:hypothetical protein [Rufibacter roseolus]|nr:hypothetical protein [Rufibacter roseolus]